MGATSRHVAWALTLLLLAASSRPASGARIWVYTLVGADYGGADLLPHFLNYYHQLGVTWRRFLVLVHHDPSQYSRHGLEQIMGICSGYAVECRVWEGPYSSEDALVQQLGLLNDYVQDPTDWVVAPDADEFQDWGGGFIKEGIAAAEGESATFIRGLLRDRVAEGGRIVPITPGMGDSAAPVASIFEQYPLICHVGGKKLRKSDFKIAAYRAFLRTDRARRGMVDPDHAADYFGTCLPRPAPCPRPRTINLQLDALNITPYFSYGYRYKYANTNMAEVPKGVWPLWEAIGAEGVQPDLHHFRWHEGTVRSLGDRVAATSGDCALEAAGAAEEGDEDCQPVAPRWRESARTYSALRRSMRLDLDSMDCALPEADVGVNTTYAGLSWEWMEETLGVRQGQMGNTIPKQYRQGQFKLDDAA